MSSPTPPAFEVTSDAIIFDSWVTDHFRRNFDAHFQAQFIGYVQKDIVPQLTGPVRSLTGRVFSDYDKPNHVGPYSIVKHRYRFVLTFQSESEVETVSGEFDYETRSVADSAYVNIDNAANRQRERTEADLRVAEISSRADPDITVGLPQFVKWTGPDLANAGTANLEEAMRFGPCATKHFQQQMKDQFRADFFKFVSGHVRPMIKGEYPLFDGQIHAAYDNERYLGPLSALKNRYSFVITAASPQGEERVSGTIDYQRESGNFNWGKNPLTYQGYGERKTVHNRRLIVDRLAYRYRAGQRKILCPLCESGLMVFWVDENYDWITATCGADDRCSLKAMFLREPGSEDSDSE